MKVMVTDLALTQRLWVQILLPQLFKTKEMKATDWDRISYKLSGIYAYRNKINNKYYIGQAVCLRIRLRQHLSRCRNNYDPNIALHRAWKKYGLGNFELIILESFDSDLEKELLIRKLDELERYYIEKYNSYGDTGYNCTKGGDYGVLGLKHTEETKSKLSTPVFVLDITTDKIHSFKTSADAAKALNVNITNIYESIRKKYVLRKKYLCGRDADKLLELYEYKKSRNKFRPFCLKIQLFLKNENGIEYLSGVYTALELKQKLNCSLSTVYDWIKNPIKYENNRFNARLLKEDAVK